MTRWLAATLLALLAAPVVHARDLSVFNLTRLDMPLARDMPVPRETWAFDAQLGYQNTWSMSPNIQDFFETRPVRRRLDAADLEAIRALPFEKFLVDMEVGVLDLTLHRKLGGAWSAYGVFGLASYNGGFMDAGIERFHDALGFREYVRSAVPRDQFTALAYLRGTDRLVTSAPSGGFLDPVLGVRYAQGPFAIDAAVKLPLGGERDFLSNGNADVGVQVAYQDSWGAHTGYASLAGVYGKGGGIVDAAGRHFVPTLTAGYEYAFGPEVSAFIQGQASRYALDRSDTDIGGLRQAHTQAAAGLRLRFGASMLTLSFLEAFGAYNGMPDLGVRIGWTVY